MEHHCADPDPCRVCGLVPVAPGLSTTTRVVVRSDAMQKLLKRASRFAASDAPVAIVGETGTGKEVVARILHANSPRAAQPFVAVNVAALPADLLESELFGHGKGAFTGAAVARRGLFEVADKGTLFLDEIGDMPLALQAKLLRALQDGEIRRVGESEAFSVDVRVVCATHRDLAQRVREGAFREDLLYRLRVLTLEVPPLRDRPDDILLLAQRFLADEDTSVTGFTRAAKKRLLAHAWPGNVRELQNAVRHGAALTATHEIDDEDLPESVGPEVSAVGAGAPGLKSRRSEGLRSERPGGAHIGQLRTLAEAERDHILFVLDACQGSQSEAARVLGVARNTLWRKLREYAGEGDPSGPTQGSAPTLPS